MGLFSNFPYSDFENINLDWIIRRVKEYIAKVDILDISFKDLKDYVSSYFDNLDLQEEVNNKLEEMYEDGRLAELISQFLELSNLLVFNTIVDMKNADNIINDMKILVIGSEVDNLLYKVRLSQSGETIDDYNLVSLTNYPNYVAELITDYDYVAKRTNDLYKKKVILLGDSLSAGFSEYGTLNKTWLDILASKYDLDFRNYSLSGSKISSGTNPLSTDYCMRIDSILDQNNTCDIFIVQGGANDKNENVEIGSINNADNFTYIGAIKNIIVKIRRKYGKDCRVLFMTTYHRFDNYNNVGLTESDYVEAMIRACSFFSIPCFNNYNNSGISLADTTYTNPPYLWADSGLASGGVATYHFSAGAYEYLAKIYEQYLINSYINNDYYKLLYYNDNGIFWTKQRMNNGLLYITFRFTKTISFNTDFRPVQLSEVQAINPPEFILSNRDDIIDISIQCSGGGYNHALLHAGQDYDRIGYAVCTYNNVVSGAKELTFYGHIVALTANL